MDIKNQTIKFLLGEEANEDGLWFSNEEQEILEAEPRRKYWWREVLRAAVLEMENPKDKEAGEPEDAELAPVEPPRYFYMVLGYTLSQGGSGSHTIFVGEPRGRFPNIAEIKHHTKIEVGDLKALVQVQYIYEFNSEKDYQDAIAGPEMVSEERPGSSESKGDNTH